MTLYSLPENSVPEPELGVYWLQYKPAVPGEKGSEVIKVSVPVKKTHQENKPEESKRRRGLNQSPPSLPTWGNASSPICLEDKDTTINHAIGAAGVVSQHFKTVVNQYGQTILDLLLSETQPKKICSQIGMCIFDGKRGVSVGIESLVDKENAKSSNGAGDAACSACEMAVVWIQSQLRQKMTQERILDYINDLSEQLSTMPTVSLTTGGKVFDLASEEVGEDPAAQCISGFIALDVAPPR